MTPDEKRKIEAVESYLSEGTLEEKASIYKIHRNTLWRWVKRYHADGFKNSLTRQFSMRHWQRTAANVEDRIVTLKEFNPSLTVRKAQMILKKTGIRISLKGIWNIWKRFGYCGFMRNRFTPSYRDYVSASSISKELLCKITALVEEGRVEEAAALINRLPVYMDMETLRKIPESFLSVRRKVERLGAEFGIIPLPQLRHKAKVLREQLEKRKMWYSALRATVDEGYALMWMGRPKELLRLVVKLKKKKEGLRDPGLRFAILLLEGHAYGSLLQIPRALQCARECKRIIQSLGNSYVLMGELSGFYSVIGYYREAIFWAKKALEGIGGDYRKHLCASLVGYLTTSGDYRSATGILKEGKSEEWDYSSRALLCEAFISLNKGDFQEASSLAVKALEQSIKEGIKRYFHLTTFILACCHASAGEKEAARVLLRRYNPLLKKYHLEKEYFLRRILLGDFNLSNNALLVPSLRLAHLFYQAKITMKAKNYRKALRYARSQELFGLFERLALFFPEVVVHLLRKGKNPRLPRSLLVMPIFQIESPVYNLKFLGRLRICKGENPIRKSGLSPKDAAFLIHMSLHKNRRMLLSDICLNFWPKSKTPSRNLSHLLVRIKKTINLSSSLLKVNSDSLEWKFHVSTDYELFKETLAQAKALERGGEWIFAKKEYLRAFKLFRGEPFKKNYDEWSLNLRHKILTQVETETTNFAKSCLEHGNKRDARKVLAMMLKIMPDSKDLRNWLAEKIPLGECDPLTGHLPVIGIKELSR
ncbi:MAG TPA: hypothetical protein VF399_07590 [bacterium]